jgi:predicted nucleic acid-binding protein
MNSIRHASAVVDVTGEPAIGAGVLRSHLRRRSRSASLADAMVLATARRQGALVLSMDRDLAGEPDVSAA